MNPRHSSPAARLYMGVQRALYVGPTVASRHRHHAVQISVGLEGDFRLRLAGGDWQAHRSAIIAPDLEHELDSGDEPVANLFLEVESEDYRRVLQANITGSALGCRCSHLPPQLLEDLRRFYEQSGSIALARELNERMVASLAQDSLAPKAIDPRIGRVLASIAAEPAAKIRVERLAAEVALSPSRLAHLFSEQVGVPIRRYRIWKAMREAIGLCLAGRSLTEAAHAAGFADSSHFSNSFRDLFGFNPGFLLARNAPVEVLIDTD